MNSGKTLVAQVMEYVPWTSFARIVARYSGDARVSVLRSAEHFRIMAFAQLTWRESLRDIEVTLSANAAKLYAMGQRQAVRRTTLADANERRDWRIWADLAAVLIRRANRLYADEPLGWEVNLPGKVYALDATMHQAGAFFVTRAKSNFNARRIGEAAHPAQMVIARTPSIQYAGTLSWICAHWIARRKRQTSNRIDQRVRHQLTVVNTQLAAKFK